MRKFSKALFTGLMLLLCVSLLCGCAASVELGGRKFHVDEEQITACISADEVPLLNEFTNLSSLDLSGSTCYSEIDEWAAAHPEVSVSYSLPMPDGTAVMNTDETLDFSNLTESDIAALSEILPHMTKLKTINLGSAFDASQLSAMSSAGDGVAFTGKFSLMGKSISFDDRELNLSGIGHEDAQLLLTCLPHMPELKSVDLGSDAESSLSWDDIAAFQAACPEAEFFYSFTIFDKSFNLSDTEMNLNHIKMDDEGALAAKVAGCMPNLQYLDMDSCGVSNEAMAEIRDSLPNVNVVWRIFFADAYSVRTDVERILASNPGLGGDIIGDNADSLKYCTKVKYLDIGHNDYMTDISFVSSMPDLEVLIIALSRVSDLSPLANCPKLDYLEVQLTAANDLSPLSGLKNLRHLNIGYCYALTDISPLFELPDLERVWIGSYVPVPPEQIEKLRETAPNCDVNTSKNEYENWRYTGMWVHGAMELCPRYELLRQQMEYGNAPDSYAYYWNDPLY